MGGDDVKAWAKGMGARATHARPGARGFVLSVSLKLISMSFEALMDSNVDQKLMATTTH